MNWNELLSSVRDAYRKAVDGNQPISSDSYLKLLTAFESLVDVTLFDDAYDTSFRKNMPDESHIQGARDVRVGTLKQKITSARLFAERTPLYPAAGEGIAQNLMAIASIAFPESANQILLPMQNLLEDIAKGKL